MLDGTLYVVKSGQDYASASMHRTRAAFHIIREGTATLVTGGKLKDPTRTPNGDFIGSGVIGGERRVVKPGDVVFIPAGVPHRWEDVRGAITYYNFRFQQK